MTKTRETEAKVRKEIVAALEGRGPFLLIGHRNPDGDCVGSMLAALLWLRTRGAVVTAVAFGGVPRRFEFLPGAHDVSTVLPREPGGSTAVVFDASTEARTGAPRGYLSGARLIINIDHHPDNSLFGHLNLVDLSASSASLIVYDLLVAAAGPPERDVATCLYAGIMADTGAFRHGNTDAGSLAAAAYLVRRGADASGIARAVYGERTLDELRLLGMVLASAQTALGGRAAILAVTEAMREAVGTSGDDVEGLASYGRLVAGVRVAVLLREEAESVRVSLRSADGTDVNEIAKLLGGGGHAAAAGATLDGPLDAARARVVVAIAAALG
jgi:phosphoesterase RecJ-like protein